MSDKLPGSDGSGDKLPKPKGDVMGYIRAWGDSSVPPTVLATFTTALHARPVQKLPLAFTPLLLFSSYANLAGYKKDAAGMTAAWSGLYALLAMRRKQTYSSKFSVRGGVRGIALGLCAVNVVAGGTSYLFGTRDDPEE